MKRRNFIYKVGTALSLPLLSQVTCINSSASARPVSDYIFKGKGLGCSTGLVDSGSVHGSCSADVQTISENLNLTGSGSGRIELNRGHLDRKIVSFCLDRQSFINRGWNDDDLGKFPNKKKGVILSMYYGIQMGTPDGTHPWEISNINGFDKGLASHIDYFAREQKKRFTAYVFDNLESCTHTSVPIKALTGKEFKKLKSSDGSYKSGDELATSYWGNGGDVTYINVDQPLVLGARMDEPSIIYDESDCGYFNLTHVIAHEAGHVLGFPHIDSPDHVMYGSIGQSKNLRWQNAPDKIVHTLFREIAKSLY